MTVIEKYINPFTDFGFKKLFGTELNKQYEESLKSYRDLKNVIDTSFGDGKKERNNEIAINMLNEGMNIELISKITGLSEEEIRGFS